MNELKLTYDDLLLLPDDGKLHELIDGEHFVRPSTAVRHQRVLGRFGIPLYELVRKHGLGEVFYVPLDVVLSPRDVVVPDLIFISTNRAAIVGAENVQGAPDLVAEVLTPDSRRHDEVRKRGLYERAAIEEYWIVDPEAETVKVFRRDSERFARPLLLSKADCDVLSTPLLPGLEPSLATLFSD
jgi:Uma2 family endonuclease